MKIFEQADHTTPLGGYGFGENRLHHFTWSF
jgi:hypothetical protein